MKNALAVLFAALLLTAMAVIAGFAQPKTPEHGAGGAYSIDWQLEMNRPEAHQALVNFIRQNCHIEPESRYDSTVHGFGIIESTSGWPVGGEVTGGITPARLECW